MVCSCVILCFSLKFYEKLLIQIKGRSGDKLTAKIWRQPGGGKGSTKVEKSGQEGGENEPKCSDVKCELSLSRG